MRIKIVVSFFVASVLAPQVAVASWWNPLTWNLFKKNIEKTQQIIVEKSAPVIQNNTPVTTGNNQKLIETTFAGVGVNAISTTTKTIVFTKPLSIGMIDPEVKSLQILLSKDKTIYPEGKVTGLFDVDTKKAVQRFQDKYNLATPEQKLTASYGAVGPKTSEMLINVFAEMKTMTSVQELQSSIVGEFKYYTIKNGTLNIDVEEFPKTIGDYSFERVVEENGSKQISDQIFYNNNNNTTESISVMIVKITNTNDKQKEEFKDNYKEYKYDNNQFFVYDRDGNTKKHYLWEIDKGIFIYLFYTKDNVGSLILDGGSDSEVEVLNWFLREF